MRLVPELVSPESSVYRPRPIPALSPGWVLSGALPVRVLERPPVWLVQLVACPLALLLLVSRSLPPLHFRWMPGLGLHRRRHCRWDRRQGVRLAVLAQSAFGLSGLLPVAASRLLRCPSLSHTDW